MSDETRTGQDPSVRGASAEERRMLAEVKKNYCSHSMSRKATEELTARMLTKLRAERRDGGDE